MIYIENKYMIWYNDFIEDEIVDINLLRDFRDVLQPRYVLKHSICCLTATGFNTSLASIKVLRNIEIFDFVIFREVLISYRVWAKRKHIDFAIAKISSKL